jgi:tellurite resistance protein|tara:strand:+ start:221 stop:652 length:432 start_codon:yes stop_codon:yes gene_type:complete
VSIFGQLREAIEQQTQRVRNRSFLEATMATCALVTLADGVVTFPERIRIDQMLESLTDLQAFDPHQAIDLFNGYVEDLQEDPEKGHARALAAVRAITDNPEASQLMLRIAYELSKADGAITQSERQRIDEIARLLEIAPPTLP